MEERAERAAERAAEKETQNLCDTGVANWLEERARLAAEMKEDNLG